MQPHGGTHCANDVRDAHERVVDGHTEVVDREPVATQNDKVAQGVRVEFDIPSDLVFDDNVLIGRHAEPVAERGALHGSDVCPSIVFLLHMLHLWKRSSLLVVMHAD